MGLGVVCHWLIEERSPRGKVTDVNALCERRLQFGKLTSYSDSDILASFNHNVDALIRWAPEIGRFAGCFRLSSGLLPVADHIDPALWRDNEDLRSRYARLGAIFQATGTRVVMHPGQFCVLSSTSEVTRKAAVKDLEIHAWILDAMGLPRSPYAALVLHGGKGKQAQQLLDSIGDLPPSVRSRLVLENDECAYSIRELLPVAERTGTPLVFDSHHHTFKPDFLTPEDAFRMSIETWPEGIRPLQHVSNSRNESGNFVERRAHSDYIRTFPSVQLEAVRAGRIDLEVEAKAKNRAVAELARAFNLDPKS